jgi:hypothetical protein
MIVSLEVLSSLHLLPKTGDYLGQGQRRILTVSGAPGRHVHDRMVLAVPFETLGAIHDRIASCRVELFQYYISRITDTNGMLLFPSTRPT